MNSIKELKKKWNSNCVRNEWNARFLQRCCSLLQIKIYIKKSDEQFLLSISFRELKKNNICMI